MINRKNVLSAGLELCCGPSAGLRWVGLGWVGGWLGRGCCRRSATELDFTETAAAWREEPSARGEERQASPGRSPLLSRVDQQLPLSHPHAARPQVKPDLAFPVRAAVLRANMKPAHLHLATRALLMMHGKLRTNQLLPRAQDSPLSSFSQCQRDSSTSVVSSQVLCFSWLICMCAL